MDKKLVLAVAGSGKTTEIIDKINYNDRTIIITYTDNNFNNIRNKIIKKFNEIPPNVRIYTYFTFLYNFCFAPLKKDVYVRGLDFNQVKNHFLQSRKLSYYMDIKTRKMYHSRLAKLCNERMLGNIINRIEKYFDNIYIDEIQDFSGNDFNFILNIIKCRCNCFLVGDFYQHTYDTSRDGSVNKNLYNDYSKYIKKFKSAIHNLVIDNTCFSKSKRCSKEVCDFINERIGISIESYFNNSSNVLEITDLEEVDAVVKNNNIIKLFYQNSKKYNIDSADNWGDSKGETFVDVCVVLNPNTYDFYKKNELMKLPPITKNKLYVACSRPTQNLYLVNENLMKKYQK